MEPQRSIQSPLQAGRTLRVETSDLLYRLLRDPRRAVWEDACYMAGQRAIRDPRAFNMVNDLLQGPLRELRLRGVLALASMADGRPDVVAEFFLSGLADADYAEDPVLMDALCTLPAHLPSEIGTDLLTRAARDEREAVRAAAAASVSLWAEIPNGLLFELALDPSSLVRCSLAFAVCRVIERDEAQQAAMLLADAEETFLREFLARELPRTDATIDLLAKLAADPDPRVRDTARVGIPDEDAAAAQFGEQPTAWYSRVSALEQRLDKHPEETFDILRPLLDSEEGLAVLDPLSHLCRNTDVGALCRALRQLLEPGHMRAEERMLTVYEMLGQPSHPAAAAFKTLIAYTVDALRVRHPSHAVMWAARIRAETAYVEAAAWLDGLGRLCDLAEAMEGQFESLSDALALLDESAASIRAEFALPERMILLLVIERWSDMLDQEIQDQVAGVTS